MKLTHPEFVVHVFAPASGPHAAEAYNYVRSLWNTCSVSFGMTDVVPGVPVGRTLPGRIEMLSTGACAAKQRPDDGVFQAVLRREGDLIILSVVLSPDQKSALGWPDFDWQWAELAGDPPASLLGEARLFLGTGAEPSRHGALLRLEDAAEAAWHQIAETGTMWRWDEGSVALGCLTVREISPRVDSRALRRIAVLAEPGQDTSLSAWTWSSGDLNLPPFARYLAQAAGVRYQLRVRADGPDPGQLRAETDTALSELIALLPVDELAASAADIDAITASAARVTRLLTAQVGLIVTLTNLRQMRRAVDASRTNLGSVISASVWKAGAQSMFSDDQAVAEWFVQRLDDDIAYLDATCERVRHVTALADMVTQRQLHGRQEAIRGRQEQFGLLQAAVIGALIMALTAIQALGYRVPLPGQAKPAIVTLLGAVALYLAAKVLTLATPQRRGALRWIEQVASLAVAAAVIWTVVALSHLATWTR